MGDEAQEAQVVPQYVYRSVQIELEPGRYSRDGWVRERWFERGKVFAPTRASQGKIIPKVDAPKGKKQPGPTAQHTPETCAPSNGLYRLTGTQPYPSGRGFTVLAQCQGPCCGGKVRRFTVWQWNRPRNTLVLGCNACSSAARTKSRQAHRLALKATGKPCYAPRGASA